MVKVPQIRFGGYLDSWNSFDFGKCFNFLKNNTVSRAGLSYQGGSVKNVHYGDVLVKFGSVLDAQSEVLPFVIDDAKIQRNSEYVLRDGDVIIADTAEDTTVGKCSEISNVKDETIVAGLHTMPVRPSFKFAFGFLGYFMNSPAYHNTIIPLIQGTKVSSISRSAISNSVLSAPASFDEQKEIATYFSSLDTLITSRQKELQKLKTIKNALLEQMFPKDGETNPRVRFSGVEAEWEKSKLGEIFDERDERSGDGDMISVTTKEGIKKASEIERFVNFGNLSKYKVVKEGDIAYNTMRMWQGACGYSPYSGILSPAYTVLSPRDGHNSKFYACLFKNNDVIHKFYLNSQGLTSDNWNLKYEAFSEIVIQTTRNEVEQANIAAIFSHLDRLITARTAQLTKLQNLKRGMLERMFVNE